MSIQANPAFKAKEELPNGARYYRCAFQVNPFSYLKRHSKITTYSDENSYNRAIVKACLDNEIEVIAITDHFRVDSSESLMSMAKIAGIHVFPAFEAVSKDGVHFLCLFPTEKSISALERVIGECGVHSTAVESPTGKYDSIELLETAANWGAICIAAHVTSGGGLLKHLKGTPRINAWCSKQLLACSYPGSIENADIEYKKILKNKDSNYHRQRQVTILNAQDVNDPNDLSKPDKSCWIKMSEVSIEGLRQAFLEPDSRVRLFTDSQPDDHIELVSISWEGGFLGGTSIHLNENLNVLIGGRGTGKSTIIESIRYALDLQVLGEDTRKIHDGIVKKVLKDGTKISLLVRSYHPNHRVYLIERTIPNPPTLRDEKGVIVNLHPSDVIPKVEVFGQHEISDLTKSSEKLTHLLDRFVDSDNDLVTRKSDILRRLKESRTHLTEIEDKLHYYEDRLSELPALEETLKRYEQAGLEEKLKEKSLLVTEENIFKRMEQKFKEIESAVRELQTYFLTYQSLVSEKGIENLPNHALLIKSDKHIERLNQQLEVLVNNQLTTIQNAEVEFGNIKQEWFAKKNCVNAEYEVILRDLQKSNIDGGEYISLRNKIEELQPLQYEQKTMMSDLKQKKELRKSLVASWEDVKGEQFRKIELAAKRVSKNLFNMVQVQVKYSGNREVLFELLRERIGGRLSDSIELLKKLESFSLTDFVIECRNGGDGLIKKYGLPKNQAERIIESTEEIYMEIEELELLPVTTISLNVTPDSQNATWQTLDELSTGQKATAVLLLLLLESKSPLIVDQPEDDLDNRFITDVIVPKMKKEKRNRQFIFSTHNANIPVLGDAELILTLSASGDSNVGKATISREHMGSIDNRNVRELVEEILEGGKEAFETRRLKYGF